ncbi:MAG: DUF1800 domain-containing protein, partial [Thermoanaerobaculia bacterium]|nr:DUF1800 domain-containing protein [Thermoanaerobaculia bacterium]
RMLPGIYRQVKERLAQGMTISQATASGDSAFAELAGKSEDYNTRYGGYMGYVMAYERVKLIPRHTANLDLTAMLAAAGANSAEDAVDHFARRFLSLPLDAPARATLVAFATDELAGRPPAEASAETEEALRRLLYLVLSTPEYQLG